MQHLKSDHDLNLLDDNFEGPLLLSSAECICKCNFVPSYRYLNPSAHPFLLT
jgi:hypothetical protein